MLREFVDDNRLLYDKYLQFEHRRFGDLFKALDYVLEDPQLSCPRMLLQLQDEYNKKLLKYLPNEVSSHAFGDG